MLKLRNNKLKLFSIITCVLVLGISYLSLSFYSIPEKVNATTWFEEENRTLSDMQNHNMQEMNGDICENSTIGESTTMIDSRDGSDYTAAKLADGECWMTQNLRIINRTISSSDSNVSSKFTIPASATWTDTSTTGNHAYYNNDTDYGAYYTWYTATAGTSASTYDICPKGWRLPTGNTSGEFYTLGMLYPAGDLVGNSNTTGWTAAASGVNGKAGRWLGASSTAAGGAYFPAAGYMDTSTGALDNVGSSGRYWSSTPSGSNLAYRLYFDSSTIDASTYNYGRYLGYSVRCVAKSNPAPAVDHTNSASGSIAVKVAHTISIDAVSGMESEVDSTKISEGTISATISANTNYKVLLHAEKTSLTSANSANTAEIPASANVIAGTNAWGINNMDYPTTYSAITDNPAEYMNHTIRDVHTHEVQYLYTISISVSSSLPADTYSTEVTITAAAV